MLRSLTLPARISRKGRITLVFHARHVHAFLIVNQPGGNARDFGCKDWSRSNGCNDRRTSALPPISHSAASTSLLFDIYRNAAATTDIDDYGPRLDLPARDPAVLLDQVGRW